MKTKNNLIKIVLSVLVIAFVFTACSKDDSDDKVDETSGNNKVTPPAWIIGTWMDYSQPNMTTGYKFTSDDILVIINDNEASLKATLVDSDIVNEVETSTSYQITITHPSTNNSTETFQFNLLDPSHIQAEHEGVTGTYTKE